MEEKDYDFIKILWVVPVSDRTWSSDVWAAAVTGQVNAIVNAITASNEQCLMQNCDINLQEEKTTKFTCDFRMSCL